MCRCSTLNSLTVSQYITLPLCNRIDSYRQTPTKMSCKDCEEIPPVSAEYAEKGKYEAIAGLKTCKLFIPVGHDTTISGCD